MPASLSVFLLALLFSAVSYLIGSVNFALLITRKINGSDIRSTGSGNAGMTNVMRSVGVVPGLLTFAGDFAKSAAAVMMGKYLFPWIVQQIMASSGKELLISPEIGAAFCGLFCVIGHVYPLYFGFRGGKGIATCAGTIAVMDWRTFLILVSIFLIVFAISRIVSLGSLIGMFAYPFTTYFIYYISSPQLQAAYSATPDYLPFGMSVRGFLTVLSAGFTLLIFFTHRSNIKRLLHGEEKRLTTKQ